MITTMLVIITVEDIQELHDCIQRGKFWFNRMDKRYPSLLYRLELGQDWENAKLKLLCGIDEIITPPSKRLTIL